MNKFNRFLLFSAIAMLLYFAAHLTLVSAYPAVAIAPVAVIDSSSLLQDTTLSDSLMMVDTTPEVITNEQIVSGSSDVQDVQGSPAQTTIVKKSAGESSDTKSKTTITRNSKPAAKSTETQSTAEKSNTTIVQAKDKSSGAAERDVRPARTEVVRKKPEAEPGGKYKVMAGTYLVKENADKMVDRLRGMGYAQARVVPKEKMFSVVAGSYDSESKAREVSEDLKRKQIDSFVREQ
jgi:cell division septation protein DedD